MLGFLRQLPGLTFAGGKSATLTLIARRGVDRAGTRQWRRGCDSKGACGCCCEARVTGIQ